MTSVLIADLRPKVREQLGLVLAESRSYSSIHLVSSYRQLLAHQRAETADLVLIGQQFTHPAEIVYRVKEICPDTKVIVVIGSTQDAAIAAASLNAGASAILRWEGRDGRSALRRARELVPGAITPDPDPAIVPRLTGRELQVLEGISSGRSNAELASRMRLTEDTVKSHARTLYRKLGARDRAQAVMIGLQLELID